MPRIAVAGFQHETNTFAPHSTSLDAFMQADAWPGMTQGEAIPSALAGTNIPMSGFLDAANQIGFEVVPTLWASANPSGLVTRDAFETVADLIVSGIANATSIDAIYLDLHGAMVASHQRDGDGELLRRIRALVGADMPIVASLDFHANVSQRLFDATTMLIGYRTYPHVDMAATGERCAVAMERILRHRIPCKSLIRGQYLIPLTAQCTLNQPLQGLMNQTLDLEQNTIHSVTLTAGFHLADVFESGPCALAYGSDPIQTGRVANKLADQLAVSETNFDRQHWSPSAAIWQALKWRRQGAAAPVILADTQDNPGGGAPGDTVHILRALIEADADGSVVAMIHDPTAAATAHAAGAGAAITINLGGKSGLPGETPLHATFTVEALGSGDFDATGPFYRGCNMQLGAMAQLKIGGVRIIVSSRVQQAADQAMLRHVGVEPLDAPIVALKSSVHFRADFEPIAEQILVVKAPGVTIDDPADLDYQQLRPGVRLGPMGGGFKCALTGRNANPGGVD